jgi:hypothetical protein
MPKQPEDHKPKADEPFIWTAPNGKKVKLKPFKKLPFGLFRTSRDKSDEERTYLLIEAATDEVGLAVVDELAMDEVDGLFEDWGAASGVEVPQS